MQVGSEGSKDAAEVTFRARQANRDSLVRSGIGLPQCASILIQLWVSQAKLTSAVSLRESALALEKSKFNNGPMGRFGRAVPGLCHPSASCSQVSRRSSTQRHSKKMMQNKDFLAGLSGLSLVRYTGLSRFGSSGHKPTDPESPPG